MVESFKKIDADEKNTVPPVRIELTTPGLRDQCSTTELKRLQLHDKVVKLYTM